MEILAILAILLGFAMKYKVKETVWRLQNKDK